MLSAPRRTAGFVTACSYFWDVSLVSTKMFEKEGTAVSRQAVGGPRRHKLLVQRMSLVGVKTIVFANSPSVIPNGCMMPTYIRMVN